MKSVNLCAETLLLQLAENAIGKVGFDNGCETLKEFWQKKGMNTDGLFLDDASGLSRANGITPAQMGFLLSYMKTESNVSQGFINSLPVSGQSGSLKNFGKNFTGKFSAKSGYMSRVMNYAGYLKHESGRDFSVVIMVNNYTCSNREMRKMLEQLISDISTHSFRE